MPHAVFVYAHQDDEIATATRITHLLSFGWTISVAYLTNGETRRAPSHVRDEESRRVLIHLGIDLARVHFLGSEERIPDGALHEHLDRALKLLDERIKEPVDAVYCLAWEGGHQDHDASHLIAAAFAARRGVLDQCFEMPLYHGRGLPGPLFRTMMPMGDGWSARRIPIGEVLSIARLSFFYRSQRKTWLALLPEALIRRREWTRRVDASRFGEKPHEGRLYYERRFGVTWEEFAAKARSFVTAQLPRHAESGRR